MPIPCNFIYYYLYTYKTSARLTRVLFYFISRNVSSVAQEHEVSSQSSLESESSNHSMQAMHGSTSNLSVLRTCSLGTSIPSSPGIRCVSS